MIISDYFNMNALPRRKVEGKVELYNGSALLETYLATDKLQEITVARAGEKGKFFGFGICQQATVKIVDNYDATHFIKGQRLRTSFRANSTETDPYDRVCPTFYIKDAKHDEKTNVYTLTAYDAIDSATAHTFNDLELTAPYTLAEVVRKITIVLGLDGFFVTSDFNLNYEDGANFAGTETLRTVLNAIAEVTQTVYYVDNSDFLVFKVLDKTGAPDLSISKNDYFDLSTSLPVTLSRIMSVTELGDNVEAGDENGVVQYVRDNPFWTLRTDISTLLADATNRISGLTIVPYNIKWRGNFLTEICDKVILQTKDGSYTTTFILDDSFTYNGGFSQTMSWEYQPDTEKTTASNALNLGEKLNQTFAKVDKANQRIELVASETSANTSALSTIQLDTESILAAVSSLETKVDDSVEGTADAIEELSKKVETSMTSEQVQLAISTEIAKGTNKVETTTGFTFNEEGLSVSKTGSAISTTITENGMTVYKDNSEVLTANKDGVKAKDLHAETFLIIGTNSRFQDYGDRTGCFWIGG